MRHDDERADRRGLLTLGQWILSHRARRRIRDDLADRARWHDLGGSDAGEYEEGAELVCRLCGERWGAACLEEEADERHLQMHGAAAARRSADYATLLAQVAAEFEGGGCRALELAFGPSDWCRAGGARDVAERGGRRRAAGGAGGRRQRAVRR